jgi:hypothetical protein
MALGPACGVTQLAHEPSHALGDDDDDDDDDYYDDYDDYDDEEEDEGEDEGDEEGEDEEEGDYHAFVCVSRRVLINRNWRQ